MTSEIAYAKYPYPAVDMGNYEYEDGKPMYDEEDISYCNGLLPDGRPFLAEHYFSKIEQTDYLVIVITADEIMDLEEREFKITKLERRNICLHQCFNAVLQMELDSIEGNLLNTEYQEEITKYLLQQGVITDGYARCDCMYLATDMDDNYIVVANYEIPGFEGCDLEMKKYGSI